MSKKKKKGPTARPAEAGRSDAGREVRPAGTPAEGGGEGERGAVPLGLPIPLERYEALQEDAKRQKPCPPGLAQEDPGGPGGA